MKWTEIKIASAFVFDSQAYIKVSDTEYFNPADGPSVTDGEAVYGNIHNAFDVFRD